jgi:hypothetical protein
MLVAAYTVSALLEIAGLFLTVRDVRRGQRAAVRLANPPELEPVTSKEAAQETGGSLTQRRYNRSQRLAREQADRHQEDVLGGMLPEGRFRPFLGPSLIALGIIVGATANMAGDWSAPDFAFDWNDIWGGLVAGLLATVLVGTFTWVRRQRRDRRDFGSLAGEYDVTEKGTCRAEVRPRSRARGLRSISRGSCRTATSQRARS